MRVKDKLTYQVLILFKKFLSNVKPKKRFWFATLISKFVYYIIPIRKHVAEKNLRIAFPSLSNKKLNIIIRNTYTFFFHNIIEFLAFPKSWVEIHIKVEGEHYIKDALKSNNGTILVSGHFGSWEILGSWIGRNFPLFTGVAIKQKNLGAHNFFIEQRELAGTKHIFKRDSISKMYDVLSKNGILGLVSDQDARKSGVFIKFFGKAASTSKGAALFHLKTKAPIIVALCNQIEYNKYNINMIPVNTSNKTVKEITQIYTNILEKNIIKYPEQYFWFHRRWKTKIKK